MSRFIAVFFFSVSILYVHAQDISPRISTLDATIGAAAESLTGSLAWSTTYGLGSSKKFRLGYGVRFSGFAGSNTTYITAPASLTKNEETIDSLSLNGPLNFGVNLAIYLEYYFNSKWSVGFNIDAIGVSFGNNQLGAFQSSSNNGEFPDFVNASPTAFNLLLVGDNDLGFLKSEISVRYTLSEHWSLRGGLDYTFSEFTTEQKLTNDNDRFRYKAGMLFLGASYIF